MKKEPWRWIVFSLSAVYIAYMWHSKGAGEAWASMPADQMLPMAVTSIAVTALKVVLIAGSILLLKWILSKLKK